MDDLIEKYRRAPFRTRIFLIVLLAMIPPYYIWDDETANIETNLEDISSRYDVLKSKLDRVKRKVSGLPELREKLLKIKDELDISRKYLPQEVEFDTLLGKIGKLENQFIVPVKLFKPGVAKQPQPEISYKELEVDMHLKGDFNKSVSFLDALVHMEFLSNVRDISMSKSQDQAANNSPAGEVGIDTRFKLVLFMSL